MSYPPRPPLMTMPYVVPVAMPTMIVTTPVSSYGSSSRRALLPSPNAKPVMANGKNEQAITVFVGNITPKAPENMVRSILQACGPVLNWKRVSAFGFCEFASPEAALRCVRLLHDRELGEKKLVARVDEKTKLLVDKYKTEQRDKLSTSGSIAGDDYMDDAGRDLDRAASDRILRIVDQYRDHMNNFEDKQKAEEIEKTNRVLEEADIEEEKRDVIHREIGKFRETMKVAPRRAS